MTVNSDRLGGRLPLLEPEALSTQQKELYDRVIATWGAFGESAHFEVKTEDGRLIGPFNPMLYSPAISSRLLDLMDTEGNDTSLSVRVREVTILAVGAVWGSDYELYAHKGAARKAGLSENEIATLVGGELPDGLSGEEQIAHRYARQLSAEHHVDANLYRSAVEALGAQGVVDLTYLIGTYHITCSLLNSFVIPAPAYR
jgi:4-carboxymuconolactone decarboxylase